VVAAPAERPASAWARAAALLCALSGLLPLALSWAWVGQLDALPPAQVRELRVAEPALRPARPGRLLWVLLDGLRDDAFGESARMAAWGERGVRLRVDVGVPSFSRPVYASLGSGASQLWGGVRSNRWAAPHPLDSLFARLAAQGGRAGLVAQGLDWWVGLFGPALELVALGDGAALASGTRGSLAERDLTLLHLLAIDESSHRHGAASAETRAAQEEAFRVVDELLRGIDLRRTTVLIQSDHGHRMGGGHGGGEPEIRLAPALLLGAGVRPQPRSWRAPLPARAVDIAPTLAALLDCAAPAQAEGRILAEVLRAPAAALEARRVELQGAQHRLWRAWVRSLAAPGQVMAWDLDPRLQAETLGTRRRLERRDRRLLTLAGLTLAVLLGAALWRRARPALVWVLAGLSYPALGLLGYSIVLGPLSFSDVALRRPFALRLAAVFVLAGLPLLLALALRVRRVAAAQRPSAGLLWGAAAALPAALVWGASLAWTGVPAGVDLAGARALFLPLVTGPLLAAACAGWGVTVWLAAAGAEAAAARPRQPRGSGTRPARRKSG